MVVKKVLKKKYPWIKDIKINKDELNKYSIIFLEFIIDPWELAKENDSKVSWLLDYPDLNQIRWSSTPFINVWFDDPKIKEMDLDSELKDALDSIDRSAALPKEMKLPRGRKFGVGTYRLSPDSKPSKELTSFKGEYT